MASTDSWVNAIGDQKFTKPTPPFVGLPDVTAAPGKLKVSGSASAGSTVCCTLVRLGKQMPENRESIARTTRFANAGADNNWTVVFHVVDPGTYLLSCHLGAKNYYYEVPIISLGGLSMALSMALSMNPPIPSSSQISASGSVFYSNNPVLCSLAPVNADGCIVPPSGMNTPPSQNQPATFIPPSTTSWTVTFTPGGMPGVGYTGWYVLEATACDEGSVSSTFPVGSSVF